ncbi:hypothetical protein VP01_1384g1 [Puccinia sorghi]|uniref:Uncharacterized protein n=1 Tax=Puccinia sorghi TaxID=27349 RepID=A0A0L6VN71_9BASI|nr:hypothetical protein VP01_1384g1 [Puccinia sorghi]
MCLDFVDKRITCSAAWLQDFKQHANAIINAMLHDEFFKFQHQITRQSHRQNCKLLGNIKEIQFIQVDWMQIKNLNDELKPFNFFKKEMEGDGPTGAFVLANCSQTIKDLKKKEEAHSQENTFHPMYHKMITKIKEYQEDPLECEPLVMALYFT